MAGGAGRAPANLGDILERVLDKGLVIAGDIQVNLLDIELLTIKLRLVIASLDTAREVGINWWENDPWLNADAERRSVGGKPRHGEAVRGEIDDGDDTGKLRRENRRLRHRVSELESGR
ncbi:MAG TPA: gas vesicle protein GvpJ [Trebonia sp.]